VIPVERSIRKIFPAYPIRVKSVVMFLLLISDV
jgi:hypothetical protein